MADDTLGNAPSRTGKIAAGVIGSTGLKQFGGIVSEEFLKELFGPRAAQIYREMSNNDPIVGAVLFAITMLIRNVEWTLQAPDDSDEADTAKDFVQSVLDDMTTPLGSVVDEICTQFTFGYAPMEIIWKRRTGASADDPTNDSQEDDGKVGIRAISLRAQETLSRWEIDPVDGTIDGMWQMPYNSQLVFIPIEKMLLFRTSAVKNNPEGRSILRTAYRPWLFKKRMEEIEGVGVERSMAGLPVARIPSEYFDADADDDQKATLQAWQTLVTNIRADKQAGVLIPSDKGPNGEFLFDLKLMNAGAQTGVNTTQIIDRYSKSIATSVLADFIFLGQAAVGSFALSSDKTALFGSAIGGFLKDIADVFNRHLLPRLWKYNNFDPKTMPKMTPGDVESVNLMELASLLTAMTGAGAPLFPDRDLENFIRKEAGLPPAPEDGVDMPTPGQPANPKMVDPRLVARAAASQVGAQAAGKMAGGDAGTPNAPKAQPKAGVGDGEDSVKDGTDD